ncbi:hypothetical protein JOC94_003904 [Bacillus thermophilus]|uniref:Uncharacterized protein n=1 Tax=Siminovitchia thermophila TaxID=1245522 RepID=A0ABS2RC19_9BACI|nr:hypothetical protein [Siminovitchia thermophila]
MVGQMTGPFDWETIKHPKPISMNAVLNKERLLRYVGA